MQIILLSGGSGSRLWPLSNDARSKQFLRLLPVPGKPGEYESMLQRVVRQIRETDIDADITVATSHAQLDAVTSQVGDQVSVVTEPERRDTFPAICLACEYLSHVKKCAEDETVVAMPCDAFTEEGYYMAVKRMSQAAAQGDADLILMGITPTYPSSKYGYVLPSAASGPGDVEPVSSFIEKPDPGQAASLIAEGALWNAGVFAFRLGYLLSLSRTFLNAATWDDIKGNWEAYPRISFDYEVAEKVDSISMVPYKGKWKDLGTWNTLTDELARTSHGNVTMDGSARGTHVFNELELPMMVIGTRDLVIAASPDGILVTEKSKSETISQYAPGLKERPMYEERRWGQYRVIDHTEEADGFKSLTKRLMLRPGASISYQRHNHRSEVWTFLDGKGQIVIGTEQRPIGRGDTIVIPPGTMHALRADTQLSFIEVQTGGPLVEEDIERFPYDWDEAES